MKRLHKRLKKFDVWKAVAFILGVLVLAMLVGIITFSFVFVAETVTPKVGVVPIKGDIFSDTYDSYLGFEPGANDVINRIKEADEDPNVKAIMLDINSGGGSIVASKELARAVDEAEKPVVAYIGEIGASGAYYVAAAADYVVCDEDSLTGSIGVISMFPNYLGLMNITGLDMTVMTSGDMKAAGNPFEEFTGEQKELYDALLMEAFDNFRFNIMAYRPQITGWDELDDGRILSGRQALAHGMVDELGSRSLALKRAAQMGGIEGEPEEKVFSAYDMEFADLFAMAGHSFASGFKGGLAEGGMELRA